MPRQPHGKNDDGQSREYHLHKPSRQVSMIVFAVSHPANKKAAPKRTARIVIQTNSSMAFWSMALFHNLRIAEPVFERYRIRPAIRVKDMNTHVRHNEPIPMRSQYLPAAFPWPWVAAPKIMLVCDYAEPNPVQR